MRVDPTRTSLIRRQFQAEILRRIRALRAAVYEFMVTLDALGLKDAQTITDRIPGLGRVIIARNESAAVPQPVILNVQPREYQFRTAAGKVQAFRDWLQEQIDAKVLSPVGPGSRARVPNISEDLIHGGAASSRTPWTAKYIQSAYKKGRMNAFIAAKKKDLLLTEGKVAAKTAELFLKSAFNQPELTSKIELLATRSFEELRGVTNAMAQQMNRILAQGMADGSGAISIAKEMTAKIDNLTSTRALVIARTEVINAHAEGQLDSFQELGIDELGVEAEWSTAGDDAVCPQCDEMEGKTFTVDEARGLIPLHPNCRCSWIPAVK